MEEQQSARHVTRLRRGAGPLLFAAMLSVLLSVLVLLGAGPADAVSVDGSDGTLSRDQVSWVPAIDEAFFNPTLAWLPGEVRNSTFWVRNLSGSPRDVEIPLEPATDQDSTGGYLTMRVQVRQGGWYPVDLEAGNLSVHVEGLLPGTVVAVTLQASLSPSAPDATMVDPSNLTFRVGPVATSRVGDGVARSEDPGSQLALAPIFLGLALVVAAAAFVLRQRSGRVSR